MPISTRRTAGWLLRRPSEEVAVRLFCLPFSGCGASMYRNWPRFVELVEICPVQLPGRENRLREKTFTSFQGLAADLAVALLPHLDRPFGFFGHCSSALIAYETTLQLARNGYPVPRRLFASSQSAPHHGPLGRFLRLTEAQIAAEVVALLRGMGAEPRPDLVEMTTEILVADVLAHKNYCLAAPNDKVPCAITTIGWDQDVEVPHQLMSGWAELGQCTGHVLPGGHYTFAEGSAQLMNLLATDLTEGAKKGAAHAPGQE